MENIFQTYLLIRLQNYVMCPYDYSGDFIL